MTSEEAGVHPNSDDMKGGYVNLVLTRGMGFKGPNRKDLLRRSYSKTFFSATLQTIFATEDTGFPII